MSTLLDYKCPSCGGAIQFDSTTQNMKCPYCDTEFEVEALRQLDEAIQAEPQEDLSWSSEPSAVWQEGEEQELEQYICQSCGGQIVTERTTSATSCPYCSNPVVLGQRVAGSLKPDCIIPFQLDQKAAQEALQKHFKGKPLLPKRFKDENHIREIKGVYVPFWLFDADADAAIRYRATRTRMWSDSNYNYTSTSYYSIHREGDLSFASVPVDGSAKMDNTLMESLEPYDISKAVDFQTAYLAGFLADVYDVSSQDSEPRANERIRTSVEQTFRDTVVGYTSVIPQNSAIRLSNGKIRYALYPVWLLSTQWNGQNYLFAMNGQTGKLVGDLPTDWGAFWKWFGLVSLGASALTTLIAYLAGFL